MQTESQQIWLLYALRACNDMQVNAVALFIKFIADH